MDEFIILDFETTGLSPAYSRIIEVGAVLVKNSKVVDKISQLMDPGCSIPYFITEITGITNKMIKGMPSPEDVMPELKKFISNRPVLAHNAAFDQKFLISEMDRINEEIDNPFLCSVKLARRLVPDAPNYKLTTLVSHLKLKIPKDHKAHRALDDVFSTYHLWTHMKKIVANSTTVTPDLNLFLALEKQPKSKVAQFLSGF